MTNLPHRPRAATATSLGGPMASCPAQDNGPTFSHSPGLSWAGVQTHRAFPAVTGWVGGWEGLQEVSVFWGAARPSSSPLPKGQSEGL